MAREKDLKLATSCAELKKTTSEALVWLENNQKLAGTQYDALKRELKLASVEARKLARAAQRPTSLAIFGPSQVGKSFMTGTLLLGQPSTDNSAGMGRVIFGAGDSATTLNFLTEVNPLGGQETTGLVTRFTVANQMKSPVGYPVCLRLLNEVDLVKILANSFVEDLGLDSVVPLTENHVTGLISEMTKKTEKEPVDALVAEDIYELEQYLQHSLKSHPLIKDLSQSYWPHVEWLAPRLKLHDRAKLFALLWGGIEPFTDLFLELKAVLDLLSHPEWIFVALDAITDTLPGKTVLHVLTMKQGLADDKAMSEQGQVALEDGRTFNVRKPVITALACELRAQLETSPWAFFEHTDLLDFPGARSRERASRETFFNTQKEPYPIGEAFLRGKVAVMFDNYAADLDLNTLVACHKAEQKSVLSFPNLVENWAQRTHGVNAEARTGNMVNLFMAVTWCDSLFDQSFGATRLDVSLENKLSFLKNFSPCITEWKPGESFNNTFLIRNPAGRELSEFFEIEKKSAAEWVELGVREDRQEKLDEYLKAFLSTEVSAKFFKDAETKWKAVVTPNDGGVTLLAEHLGPACDADVKFNQVVPKERALRKSLSIALTPFFEDVDLESRVKKRTAAIREVIIRLRKNISIVPKFIGQFQLSHQQLRNVYVSYRHNHMFGMSGEQTDIMSIGEAIVKSWINSTNRLAEDELLCASYLLTQDHMRTVIGEFEAGMKIVDIIEAINQKVSRIEEYSPGSTKNAEYVSTMVAMVINDFINFAGCGGDVKISYIEEAPLFERKEFLIEEGLPLLTEHTIDMEPRRQQYAEDWFKALIQLTKVNASSSKGSLINVEQNARLGKVLVAISGGIE